MKRRFFSPSVIVVLITAISVMLSIGLTFWIAIAHYRDDAIDRLFRSAETASLLIENSYCENDFDSLHDCVNASGDMFQYLLSSSRDTIAYYIADADGKMLQYGSSGENPISEVGRYLPEQVMKKAAGSGSARRVKNPGQYFEGAEYAVVVGLRTKQNADLGYFAMAAKFGSTVNFGWLVALLAALVLLWVTSIACVIQNAILRKEAETLEILSQSAMKCANGDFKCKVNIGQSSQYYQLGQSFNTMVDALWALNETRNDFMSSVSHDLRTPMTTISGFIDCIMSGAIPKSQIPEYLENIRTEVMRLSRLVAAMLDISRIQNGERRFVEENFDICELLRLVVISFEKRIDAKKLNVKFDTDQDRIIVRGDKDAINQVVFNLIDNAVKFSKDGGILTVYAGIGSGEGKVIIGNQGEGIREEDIPLVFERFYKADKSRGKDRSGFGLGLYISQQIIRAHSRRISVASVPGNYCLFGFSLPVASEKTDSEKSDYDE